MASFTRRSIYLAAVHSLAVPLKLMKTEMVLETSVLLIHLTQLIAREDFIEYMAFFYGRTKYHLGESTIVA
jgi:hypothetical protein